MNEQLNEAKNEKTQNNLNKFITFFLENEEFAVDIKKIKEIIGIMEITSVPNTPEYIKGVLNLRGKIIPVIDLRTKFGMEFKEYGERTSIIILEIQTDNGKVNIGTIVDTVTEVIQISDEQIEETPNFGVEVDTTFIIGMARIKDKVKIILDIDKILTSDEINTLNKVA